MAADTASNTAQALLHDILGPIRPILAREDVTDLCINGPGLLFAEADEGRQPLMWAREVGKGRVVYDSLGHDTGSITHPTHSRILKRSTLWALGRDAEMEAI